MNKKEDLVYKEDNSKFMVDQSFKIPKQVVIETDHIFIKHKDLGFTIDVDTEQIEELHRITINGVSFIRENKKRWKKY